MKNMHLRTIAYHRNGVGGEGFYAIAFSYREDGRSHRMVATVFGSDDDEHYGQTAPCTGRVAALDADLAAAGVVGRDGKNTWRGDNFEPQLRQWIAAYQHAAMVEREGQAPTLQADQAAEAAA